MTERVSPDEITIDELKRLQCDADLSNLHLVWLGPKGFNLAHTDTERASGEPLEDCALHRCLAALDECPAEPGRVYVVVPEDPDDRQATIAEVRCPYGFFPYEEWVS